MYTRRKFIDNSLAALVTTSNGIRVERTQSN